MDDRKRMHELVDQLPEEKVERVRRIMEEAVLPKDYNVFDELDKLAKELTKDITDEQWATLPTDLSYNHDHYAYGTPKLPLPKEMIKRKLKKKKTGKKNRKNERSLR